LKILYLSQLVPYPPDAGAKVRQYYVLRYLTQSHKVTLVAFKRSDDQPEAQTHLEALCQAVHTVPMVRSRARDALALAGSWLSGQSFIIRRDSVPEMVTLVHNELLAGDYDAIHADQLWMAQYALLAAELASAKGILRPKLILDEHNACYQIFQRLAKGETNPMKRQVLEREWRALQRYEARACAQFDHVVTVTEEDRDILERMAAGVTSTGNTTPHFTTIPICVDTDSVQSVTPQDAAMDVLHLGTMFWPPNVEGVLWFARWVWPIIRSQIPGSTFNVVGKNPPEALKALVGQGIGITVTGYMPDPQPYLERAGAFVVPLFSAGGMRVKIVDGWRWGLPVISTSIGAEGIRYQDGENIIIADNPETFASAVVRVLQDKELNQRLRVDGRRWVEEQYNWRRIYPAWEAVYGNPAEQ
jgi:glycosyltransferase involved in cell wall biosynthesis